MDTVILAGGKGSRMGGMPAYFKPLIPISGRPLLARLVDHAWVTTGGRQIVVAAPQNAGLLTDVVQHCKRPDMVDIIVQPAPEGPGAALSLGLRLVETEDVLALMGDNLITYEDMAKLVHDERRQVVGIHEVGADQAERLTYWTGSEWVEKIRPATTTVEAWLGPFKSDTTLLKGALTKVRTRHVNGEWPIGASFNFLGLSRLPMTVFDIGTPEDLP